MPPASSPPPLTPPRSSPQPPAAGAHLPTLTRLAWRNIWRQRRRTALLIAAVAYATIATIFFWGFNDGFNASILRGQARFLVAPMMIMTEAQFRDPNPENFLPSLEVGEIAMGVPGVEAVAPRLEFPALLRSPYSAVGTRVRGVDPQLEPAVSAIPDSIAEGRMIAGQGELILGFELAERLDVRVGERLVIDASALAGPQGMGFEVVGLIDSGLAAVDGRMVLIDIDDARALTGVTTATALALEVANGRDLRLRDAINAQLPPEVRAFDLLTLLGPVAARVRVSRYLLMPIGLLFAVFAALAVISTLLVSVMERTREFGVVIALGLEQRRLARLVVLEALFTTLIGWLVGLALGYALVGVLGRVNVLGPVFASAARSLGSFGIGKEIYTASSPLYALIATVTIALSAVLALLFPARRVRQLEPVPAMRD